MSHAPVDIAALYRTKQQLYRSFALKVQELLGMLTKDSHLVLHSITAREKDPDKLFEKINRPGKQYEALQDITDLAGVRVITYLPEDVDAVAEIVDSNFNIDSKNSIDKRLVSDPSRFGYASLHKVCSFNAQRLALPEYRSFATMKCGIQIRTVLQHAWAEIEHDLGYKSNIAVPDECRRRFSRLSALLELADEEFTRVKADLARYSEQAKAAIEQHKPGVPIDMDTIRVFCSTNRTLRELVAVNGDYVEDALSISPDSLNWIVEKLRVVGVDTIDALAAALERHRHNIPRGDARCAEVDYGDGVCHIDRDAEQAIWMTIQLLCAEKPTREESLDAYRAIELFIADSLEDYADSLRAIVNSSR